MVTESERNRKMQLRKNYLLKTIRQLTARTRLRHLQLKYDSKIIHTLQAKNPELYRQIMDEVKPDLEAMRAQKKQVYDEVEVLRRRGMWFKKRGISG